MAPQIHTYHCICLTLLLSSTHQLSLLPTRSPHSPSADSAIILPIPSSLPDPNSQLPPEGYTQLLNIEHDRKPTIIRREGEGGFEKRVLLRCGRCRVVVGYEVVASSAATNVEAVDTMDTVSSREGELYKGKIIYILPGAVMSTNFMIGKKIREEDLGLELGGKGERDWGFRMSDWGLMPCTSILTTSTTNILGTSESSRPVGLQCDKRYETRIALHG